MSATINVHNIKYFAPIAISRLYEKQTSFFNNRPLISKPIYPEQICMKQRRIQSEKQFEKMQKMMFPKSKDDDRKAYHSPSQTESQTESQKTQELQ